MRVFNKTLSSLFFSLYLGLQLSACTFIKRDVSYVEINKFIDKCKPVSIKEIDNKTFSTWEAICDDGRYSCTTYSEKKKKMRSMDTFCKNQLTGKRIAFNFEEKVDD